MDKKELKKLVLPFLLILIGFGVISLSVELFSEISEHVVTQQIRTIDTVIIDLLEYILSPRLIDVMIFITELGSVWFIGVVSLAIVMYLWFKERDKWGILFYLITIGGGGLMILLLKRFYQIDRPSINEQIDAIGYSFPSGHAMGSLLLYGFIIYLILKSELSKTIKMISSIMLISLIILIAISRVYLSAHFPSDVVAGQASGLAWLLVCIIALEITKYKTRHGFKINKMIRSMLDKFNQLR